jgi:hypothetical protein
VLELLADVVDVVEVEVEVGPLPSEHAAIASAITTANVRLLRAMVSSSWWATEFERGYQPPSVRSVRAH